VRADFDTLHNFRQLRIDPYLVTTAERHPPLAPQLLAIAGRLAGSAQCLVHGDFSPKNLLVSPCRLVVLDCEAAWFGDPAFDIAFLLNHLLLKSLLWDGPAASTMVEMARAAWSGYREQLTLDMQSGLEQRLVPLLLALMLARVDGKSPVEYLGEGQQQHVRQFVRRHLPNPPEQLESLLAAVFMRRTT
jgi:Ser/Thr protein kinase RdoA (MazF antagonist)